MILNALVERLKRRSRDNLQRLPSQWGIPCGDGAMLRWSASLAHLTWALAVLGKRQSCVRMHEAGPVSF